MDEVLAELDMGIEFIEVKISYRLVQSNDETYVEFQSVAPQSDYYAFRPEHRKEVEDSARKWCSDNAITLSEPADKEPEEFEERGMGLF